ncbi:hypothetical protein Tco_0389377 [Tanacetum coccineum]
MPPRRFKKKSVRKTVEKRVAKAIEKYKKTRADSNNTGGSGSTNTGGTVVPEMHGCSYKTFMNGKPHSFKGTEGVVGLNSDYLGNNIQAVIWIAYNLENTCVRSKTITLFKIHGFKGRPSHEGYRNIIELPERNNVVPLRSDTIWLVQNGSSFHGLRSEDPNQHLKDFLKLVNSLDLDVANRERTRLRLFQFSLRDLASNWLERLPA